MERLNLAAGKIDNLALNSTAQVTVADNTSINKLDVNKTATSSKVNVSAGASIEQLNVNAGGTTFEKKAENVVTPSNIGNNVDTKGDIVYNDNTTTAQHEGTLTYYVLDSDPTITSGEKISDVITLTAGVTAGTGLNVATNK